MFVECESDHGCLSPNISKHKVNNLSYVWNTLFHFRVVTPKTEEASLIVGPSVLVRGPLTMQDVLKGKHNGSASSSDPSLSSACELSVPRKKRKVSFAPGPPTSFSHHEQLQEITTPESALRRNTRSSSQGKLAMKTLAESSVEVAPAHTSSATSRTTGKEEKEEKGILERLDLPSVSTERLSDEESISSCGSSVASIGESSSTPTVEGVAVKRRGRPRKKSSLAREKRMKMAASEEGGTRVESASEHTGAKVVEPLAVEKAVERAFKTGIVTKQSKARGESVSGE